MSKKPTQSAASSMVKKTSDTSKNITAEAVVAFLKNNPKFLEKNPGVMDYLVPPKTGAGKNVRDFMSFMVEKLKADKEKVVTTARTLVENARSNMNNQQRIQNVILRILEARTFEEFIEILTMDMAAMLDTDICVLVVESDGTNIPHVHTSGIRMVPQGTIDKWMGGKDSLLQSNIAGIEVIYGGAYSLVQSQALLRVDISMETPPAILAFGSRDPLMFEDGQGTEQISFLARVVERQFRSWLHIG